MKKITIAMKEETELSEEMKLRIDKISRKMDGQIMGVIHYPEMLMLNNEDVLYDAVKMIDTDCILFTDTNCLISEIINDCSLTGKMDRIGVTMIDVNAGEEIKKVIDKLPQEIKNSMKWDFRESNKDMVLILSDQSMGKDEMERFIEGLDEKEGIVAEIELNQYQKHMNKRLIELIEDYDIHKVIVFNESSSQDFKDFIDTLPEKGISVEIINHEQSMSEINSFYMSFN